jgi:hypothetical protein
VKEVEMDDNTPLDERLPYQMRPLVFPNGVRVEELLNLDDQDDQLPF